MASNEQRRRDSWSRAARKSGYRSRAAYKLLELQQRYRLMAAGQRVIDLGAAPGSWSQIAAHTVQPSGQVLAIDLQDIAPIDGVQIWREDVHSPQLKGRIINWLQGRKADLVMSDMAPNLSGIAATDQEHSRTLVLAAAALATKILRPKGFFVCKLFHGNAFEETFQTLTMNFDTLKCHDLHASRRSSSEIFCVAKNPVRDAPIENDDMSQTQPLPR